MKNEYQDRWRVRVNGVDHRYVTWEKDRPHLYCTEEFVDLDDTSIPSIVDDSVMVVGPHNHSMLRADEAYVVGQPVEDFNPCVDCRNKDLLKQLGE